MSVWAGMEASKRVPEYARPWSWAFAPQSEAALLDNSVRRRLVLPEGLPRQSSLEWRTPTVDKNVALVLRGRRLRRLASSRLADAPKVVILDVDFLVPAAALPVGLNIWRRLSSHSYGLAFCWSAPCERLRRGRVPARSNAGDKPGSKGGLCGRPFG